MTWEDEVTRDVPPWNWEEAGERAMGRDDRQQAEKQRREEGDDGNQ